MTITEWPASTSRCSTSTRRCTSAMCRPMVGSSRMKRLRFGLGRSSRSGSLQTGEQVGDQFDALGFAAAEGGAGLAELQIVQAGVAERLRARA